jgi:hypothetical protein
MGTGSTSATNSSGITISASATLTATDFPGLKTGDTDKQKYSRVGGDPGSLSKKSDSGGGSGSGDFFSGLFKTLLNVGLSVFTGGASSAFSGIIGGIFGGSSDKKA